MSLNDHSKLKGTHALLSPSTPYWLGYDDQKLLQYYHAKRAAEIGTWLHANAERDIALGLKTGIKRPKNGTTYCRYVNDAIGYRMNPELVLYYSPFCYGTSDALTFKNGLLRIHDLKTGVTKPHDDQLKIYAALYCLEHDIRPGDIEYNLAFYQNDDKIPVETNTDEIAHIMDRIITTDKILTNEAKFEEG